MRKVYQSIYFQFSTFVKVDGKNVPIEFKGGVNYGNIERKGTYITDDKKIQDAIESDARFGWEFFLREGGAPAVGIKNEKKDPLPVEGIEDFQSAKDYLRKEYDIPHQSLSSPENILKKAEEVGVSFPNLKTELAE